MTRKEQIIEILKKYQITTSRGQMAVCLFGESVYKEFADAILALPIDVPGDEEIKDESLNGQINFYDSKFLSWLNDEEQHIFITSAKWMRDEILKRNRP
jgi:hypothetical protein